MEAAERGTKSTGGGALQSIESMKTLWAQTSEEELNHHGPIITPHEISTSPIQRVSEVQENGNSFEGLSLNFGGGFMRLVISVMPCMAVQCCKLTSSGHVVQRITIPERFPAE